MEKWLKRFHTLIVNGCNLREASEIIEIESQGQYHVNTVYIPQNEIFSIDLEPMNNGGLIDAG